MGNAFDSSPSWTSDSAIFCSFCLYPVFQAEASCISRTHSHCSANSSQFYCLKYPPCVLLTVSLAGTTMWSLVQKNVHLAPCTSVLEENLQQWYVVSMLEFLLAGRNQITLLEIQSFTELSPSEKLVTSFPWDSWMHPTYNPSSHNVRKKRLKQEKYHQWVLELFIVGWDE